MYKSWALANPDFLRRLRLKYPVGQAGVDPFVAEVTVELDRLVDMHRISVEMRNELVGSIGPYMNLAKDVTFTGLAFHDKVNLLELFWQGEALQRCPHWFEFAMISYLHQPSSAAAERVFSILKSVLTSNKEHALDDIIKAAVYTIYTKLSNRR